MLMLDETTTSEQWKAWGEEMGLHRPMVVQYVVWIGDSLRIDFGTSRERRTSARTIALNYALASLPASRRRHSGGNRILGRSHTHNGLLWRTRARP